MVKNTIATTQAKGAGKRRQSKKQKTTKSLESRLLEQTEQTHKTIWQGAKGEANKHQIHKGREDNETQMGHVITEVGNTGGSNIHTHTHINRK